MDLTEFLRARLDEDAVVARKAAPPPWSVAEVPTPSGVGKGKMGAIVSPEAKTAPVALAHLLAVRRGVRRAHRPVGSGAGAG